MEIEKPKNSLFAAGKEIFDFGKPNTVRHNVLVWVVNEQYEKSIQALSQYIEAGSSYPDFKEKSTRFVNHCIDLVHAIKAKRNFPGINSLTYSRQKELSDKYKFHIKELQDTLIRIENIYQNLRVQDVRSTVYVVKALWISAAAIILFSFGIDLFNGLAGTSVIVTTDWTEKIVNFIFP